MAHNAGTAAAAAPQARTGAMTTNELYPMVNWKYDLFQWLMSILVDLFFREVQPRGSWKVPKTGPLLFVAAPHANQFVDGAVLTRTLRQEAGRRVSQLIAQKSVHGIIGWMARQVGAVPVGRAQDASKLGTGTIYLPDPIGDPTLIRGVGTRFGQGEAEVGGMLFLPSAKKQTGASIDISEIVGPEEIRIKRPFTIRLALEQLTGRDDIDDEGRFLNQDVRGCRPGFEGTKYKLAPHIDQTKVYEAVFNRLKAGGCAGIFPEGGSHDRTELLPLKAGVAVMALGALAEAPDCGLQIVPVGMNYFHAHKFRSRAVVEFGTPFEIPPELVRMYKNNQRRDAIGQLLDMVYQSLSSVIVSTPDWDTLMVIQAARRLYKPTRGGKRLPLPIVVELNRRLAMGYERYKDDERIIELKGAVNEYNRQLRYLNLRDHQVEYATMSRFVVILTLIYRVLKLLVLSVGVLPGLILFSPVFIATKIISVKKAKEALAGSTVKIQGRDVMATWKILVAIVLTPTVYHVYSILLAFKTYQDRLWGFLPDWVPLWLVYFGAWPVMVAMTFAALRFGEVGMDISKSLRPLLMCLNPSSSYNIQQVRETRSELSAKVTDLIYTLGPEMFPGEFDRLIARDVALAEGIMGWPETAAEQSPSADRKRRDSEYSATEVGTTPPHLSRRATRQSSRALPRNDSFSNIGGVALFSTRPPSRSRSRSSSAGGLGEFGFPVSGFTTLDSQAGLDEASRRIRDAMRQRRRKASVVSAGTEGTEGTEETEEMGDSDDEGYNEARKKDA